MTFGTFAVLALAHLYGDFVVQTDWQAKHKARNPHALFQHTLTYGLVIALASVALDGPRPSWVLWVLVNFVAHTATDAVTSQGTRYFSRQDPPDWHNFFVVVGVDQTIHYLTLVGTWGVL